MALLAAGVAIECDAQQAAWPTQAWSTSNPQAQGLNPDPLIGLQRDIAAGNYGYIDRLVVVRNGWLVLNERYDNDYRQISQGRDTASHQYNYFHPDWHPYYMGRPVHTLQSVTKSITSLIVGIAIGRGDIEGVEARILPFFVDYAVLEPDDRRARITLEDVLTMRAGIEWHEVDRSFEDPTNTTIQLEASDDWIHFTLNQPMDHEPGEVWVYNSGASHLLSGIIKQATGSDIATYAETHLFEPLGIRDYHWKRTPKGYPDTEGGLYLEAEDLAKFGYLMLNDGVWGDLRLLPAGWVEASTRRHVEDVAPENPEWNMGYGYKWWRVDRPESSVWAALGFGGQYLLILPEYNLIGVINSWNIFGQQTSIRDAFIDALIESARESG